MCKAAPEGEEDEHAQPPQRRRRAAGVMATCSQEPKPGTTMRIQPCNKGPLTMRIGFWGPLYYNYNKEPQNSIDNYLALTLCVYNVIYSQFFTPTWPSLECSVASSPPPSGRRARDTADMVCLRKVPTASLGVKFLKLGPSRLQQTTQLNSLPGTSLRTLSPEILNP